MLNQQMKPIDEINNVANLADLPSKQIHFPHAYIAQENLDKNLSLWRIGLKTRKYG